MCPQAFPTLTQTTETRHLALYASGRDPSFTLAQLPIACVAVLAGACPLPRRHLGAVGIGGAASMIMGTGVHF